ncbi:MAG: biosynthetic arginine decarboxylase [Gammaproteobacteria bacterium]|nr:MAG: biosynthetic arginine decarboxylase [Gammaproteobacteria bacterium]
MWRTAHARKTYGLPEWGEGYFDVAENGHLVVRPRPELPPLDLFALAGRCREAGLRLPLLVRFPDLLEDRVARLYSAFEQARARLGYPGHYHPVYPIKVNQQRTVVRRLARHPRGLGLEVGSKPELMIALAEARAGARLVCNGYKDREYVELALVGRAMGLDVILVVEKPVELPRIHEAAAALGIPPRLGLRARLASVAAGKWQNSGGEGAKFGLDAGQLLAAVEWLRDHGRLDALVMLHAHLGSQVSSLRDIRTGVRELARLWAELTARGAALSCVDVGGGLGVDYEGTHARSECSVDYDLAAYAETVVGTLAQVAREAGREAPDIVTEAGRAMTAHHALLMVPVVDREPAPGTGSLPPPRPDEPEPLRELRTLLERIEAGRVLAQWEDALYWREAARARFLEGTVDLDLRARAEALFFAVAHRVRPLLDTAHPQARAVREQLDALLADKYFIDLSVFQSLPDVWALRQVFPIVPLHRLDDPPTRRAILQDLTCDSDGRIPLYASGGRVEAALPVHPWRQGEEYVLGIFLVGAYQEILGDLHNLFGDTDAVDVVWDPAAGEYRLRDREPGDTVEELLRYVHYDPAAMAEGYRARLAGLPAARREAYLRRLEAGLRGYTYLE